MKNKAPLHTFTFSSERGIFVRLEDYMAMERERNNAIAENQMLQNYNGQLNTMLDAWYSAFGTNQLTHALARLEAAEKRAERQTDDCKKIPRAEKLRLGKI